jgi:hypothetical protein
MRCDNRGQQGLWVIATAAASRKRARLSLRSRRVIGEKRWGQAMSRWTGHFLLAAFLLLPISAIAEEETKSPQETYPNLPPQMAEKCAEELRHLIELSMTRKTREYRIARERYRRDGCETW